MILHGLAGKKPARLYVSLLPLTFFSLLVFSMTNNGNKGFGGTARIPLDNQMAIAINGANNVSIEYENKSVELGKLKAFAFDDERLFGDFGNDICFLSIVLVCKTKMSYSMLMSSTNELLHTIIPGVRLSRNFPTIISVIGADGVSGCCHNR